MNIPLQIIDDCEIEWQAAYEIFRRHWRQDPDSGGV
jgi:hypothetical protein